MNKCLYMIMLMVSLNCNAMEQNKNTGEQIKKHLFIAKNSLANAESTDDADDALVKIVQAGHIPYRSVQPITGLRVLCDYEYDSMSLKRRYEIRVDLHEDLAQPFRARLCKHAMVHSVSPRCETKKFVTMCVLLKNQVVPKENIGNRDSFFNLLRNNAPLSKNAKKKLKNILHSFLQISTYLEDGRVKKVPFSWPPRFYLTGKYEHIFAPDFADYIAPMESNMEKCAQIARIQYQS